MKKIFFLVVVLFFVSSEFVYADSRIDMWISPIRDEFSVQAGWSMQRTIKFYNNSTSPTLVYITTEDCVQGENYSAPKCRSFAGTWWLDPDNASTWIKIDGADRFTVPAKSEKIVKYTVSPPKWATPGGHYGAIFFNNPGQSSAGNSVDMVRRIGMLYLINVPWNIIVDTELGDILIDIPMNSAPDIWDRLKRNPGDRSAWKDILGELNPFWESPTLDKTNLQVSLNIPVQNLGNIHVKPTGKIYLYDGEIMLKKIGKESIIDPNWVYIGERIVDYLPINDERGNVLPNSERIFRIDWLGFASQEINTDGSTIISFESPSDYFARNAQENIQVLYPWEKLSVRNGKKNLVAKVEFSYRNPKTNLDEVSTLELPVEIWYNYIAKTTNWGIVAIILVILLMAWVTIRKRNQEIDSLEDEVGSLDDEIAVLEKAQRDLLKKKASPKVIRGALQKTVENDTNTIAPKPSKKEASKKKPVKSTTTSSTKEWDSSAAQKKSPIRKAPVTPRSTTTKTKSPQKKSAPKSE